MKLEANTISYQAFTNYLPCGRYFLLGVMALLLPHSLNPPMLMACTSPGVHASKLGITPAMRCQLNQVAP